MQRNINALVKRSSSTGVIATNSVIRNTYILLSMTLLFSAATAFLSSVTNAPFLGIGPIFLLNIGLIYLVKALQNSAWGILAVFLFTGFFGYTLGPVINMVLAQYTNGTELLATSLGLTGTIFFALSCYAMVSRKDFSYLGGFLFAAIIIAIVASFMAIFMNAPILSLIVSCAFVLIASGMILFETSQIINGGETNYINATIILYVQIYNLFISLLQILTMFSGKRN
ncbi:MAG: Bax inhibitor-1/YccA family protein [Gammaproteobacteria bacterium]